ncbi:hypothetical protein [Demequina soli]|uniref:hypothetical protein n=1 Tax=Demequina soli TaxID=1638987 RepID=UPI0012E07E74|nr:hypothetical protein [Demequina soli]
MENVTRRVAARAVQDFDSAAPEVIARLGLLNPPLQVDLERVHAAVLITANGRMDWLEDAMSLALLDWRDLCVGAGLAGADYARRLDDILGRPNQARD